MILNLDQTSLKYAPCSQQTLSFLRNKKKNNNNKSFDFETINMFVMSHDLMRSQIACHANETMIFIFMMWELGHYWALIRDTGNLFGGLE